MEEQRRVIALGFFDGVHLGHGALLRRVAEVARRLNAVPAAFTFDRHPESVIPGREPVSLINSAIERGELMRRLYGIREVIMAHFDQTMMRMDWRDFVTKYLTVRGAVHLVAGHDFRFGYKGEGTARRLKDLCGGLGIGCDVIPKVEVDGITVSSTYIRSLIGSGELEEAARFLGHPHVLSGTVVHGKELGRTLGTPTANLTVPDGVLSPAFGVYAARVWILPNCSDNHEPPGPRRLPVEGPYMAVTNVGMRPTVSDAGNVTVEPWILDFHGDLYGRNIRLELYKRLRPERRFGSTDELRAAILQNAEETRQYFAAEECPPC